MPETATVQSRSTTRDNTGGTVVTYTTLSEPVICRVGAVRDQMRAAFEGQLKGKAGAVLTAPVDAPINENDRVLVLGGKYDVVAYLGPTSYQTARRMLIREV